MMHPYWTAIEATLPGACPSALRDEDTTTFDVDEGYIYITNAPDTAEARAAISDLLDWVQDTTGQSWTHELVEGSDDAHMDVRITEVS